MKKVCIALSAVSALALALSSHSADAQLTPAPIVTLIPTFSCSATVSGTTGLATITKTNAGTVDKTTDVTATIHTPSGPVPAWVCGSIFSSTSKISAQFYAPPTTDKSWVYTCTAKQTTQTRACNPPK